MKACRLSLYLVATLLHPILITAQWGSRYCENDKLPMVLLHRNSSTGAFTLVKRISSSETEFDEGSIRQRRLDIKGLSSDTFQPGLLLEGQASTRPRRLQNEFAFGNEITGPVEEEESTESPTIAPTIPATPVPQEDVVEEEYFYARECSCFADFPTVYCPLIADVCQAPEGDSGQELPGCLTLPASESKAQILLYLTLAGFWIVAGLLIFTKNGRSALDYPITWCFPGWTRHRVNQMIRDDPHRTARLLQAFGRRRFRQMERLAMQTSRQTAWTEEQLRQQQRQDLEEAGVNNFPTLENETFANTAAGRLRPSTTPLQPTSFSLRTCTFVPSTPSTEEHDEMDSSCTICFAPLLEGERVGALSCQHVFHVDCLKMWVQRRNVCPLCQTREIATPIFGHEDGNRLKPPGSSLRDDEEGSTDLSSTNERSLQETNSSEVHAGSERSDGPV